VSEELHQIADQINLGPHQHPIDAADETGQIQQFVVHRPTIGDGIKISVNAALYLTAATLGTDAGAVAGHAVAVSEEIQNTAEAVATLNQVIDMRPAGIAADVRTWVDETLVGNLWNAFLEWRNSFRLHVSAPGVPDSSPAEPETPGLAV
jgi:hypothetical protein